MRDTALQLPPGQQQAILNAIVAHEVLAAGDLKTLYQKAAPEALLIWQLLNKRAAQEAEIDRL